MLLESQKMRNENNKIINENIFIIDDIVNRNKQQLEDIETNIEKINDTNTENKYMENFYVQKKCNRSTVEREVAASLESVLPRTELRP
jgi:hypothetical protein